MDRDRLVKRCLFTKGFDADDPQTRERETRALEEAGKELGIKGQLITPDNYWNFILV